MIRLWFLIRYFTNPKRPNSNTVPLWHDEISHFDFWSYLIRQKHFCEDWRGTFQRYYYFFSGKKSIPNTEYGMKWAKNQKQRIDDLISEALKREYLLVTRTTSQHPTQSETYLTIDFRGRKFINNPLIFFETLFKEYGHLTSFLMGAGGTFVIFFWHKIIGLVATFI